MFVNPEQMQQIAEHMQKKYTAGKRIDAINNLLQNPTFDPQSNESWPAIRNGLVDALNDHDEHLWVSCWSFWSHRTFICTVHKL